MSALTPPRLRSNEPGDRSRHASWLELFYDLVYVLVIATLAHELHETHDVVQFAALFVPVWWSWVGVTLYNDRFDTDDLGHRLLTFLAMGGAAAMALAIRGTFNAPVFALAYVFLRMLLIVQYLRVARHVPLARPLGRRYALGFAAASALWLASLAVDAPARYAMWAVAMVVDVGTPLTARKLQAQLPLSRSHLPERVGLFAIIVLGEAVSAIVRGADRFSLNALIGGALGLAVAFAVWWLYFDDLGEHVVRRSRLAGQVWFYAHLPLAMGITAMAVGVEGVVALAPGDRMPPTERWLLAGGVAIAFLALAIIHSVKQSRTGPPHGTRRAALRVGSALVALVLGALGGAVPAIVLATAFALLCVALVAAEPTRAPIATAS